MEDDGVQVFVESSWNVLQGSLDKSVIVVFLDPQTHDPVISTFPDASEKLVLAPPAENVPCEITVTFQGRLCHVQSFYTLSTARICELYSQPTKTDREYICTVKGWIPYENSCFSEEGAEVVAEAADVTHINGMQPQGFIEDNIHESVLSSMGSSIVGSSAIALNPAVDVKSVYSSSDDSWVDVKLHGSCIGENACVSSTAPECVRLPLIEHELANLEDQLVLGRLRSKSKPKDTGVEADFEPNECFEVGMQFKEHITQGNARQDMFEAELELVDHNPWAAITIRLLSLQNKSLVEVDQMILLAAAGPVPEPANPCQSAVQGANSLFASFVPVMLQMARGVSGNNIGAPKRESSNLLCEQPQDMIGCMPVDEMRRSCEAPLGAMGRLPAGAVEIEVTSFENAFRENASVQKDSQDLAAHALAHEAGAVSKAGSLLNLAGGYDDICDSSGAAIERTVEMGENQEMSHQRDFNPDDLKRRAKIGRDQESFQQICFHGAQSKRAVEIGDQPSQQISQQSDFLNRAELKRTAEIGTDEEYTQKIRFNGAESKRAEEMGEQLSQSDSKSKKSASNFIANDVVAALEAFSERFDRLESLCLRMESCLQRTLENLDQRIKHLEVQHRSGSDEEANHVTASLKQASMSLDVHDSEVSRHSGLQDTAPSDLPPRAGCKEEVSISLTQCDEPGFSTVQIFNEIQMPILFDETPVPTLLDIWSSDSAVAEKHEKEAPSKNQEVSQRPATMVGSMTMQNNKSGPFLDEAWASALSAFASSFMPAVGAENTVPSLVNLQPLGTSDASISMSQEYKTPSEERSSIKAPSHCDVDFANDAKDLNPEAVKFEDGLVYEDCAQAHCDEQMPTGHAFTVGMSSQKPGDVLSSISPKVSTLVQNDIFDLLGLQSKASKARTENVDLAGGQGFSGQGQAFLSACPVSDIFASACSNFVPFREPKTISLASGGFKAGLSPVFDCTSSETQDVDFLSLNSKKVTPSKQEETRNFYHSEEKNQDHLDNFVVETLTEEVRPSLPVGASKASQTEENKEECFCNTSDLFAVDLLADFISSNKGKVLDMSDVQDPESFNSSLFTYCEADGAASFPDVCEEDCSNYQDGRACSEDSLCFSQDFDTCPNELCDDEWSCAHNIFFLNDPELTDDETNIAVEEKIEMSEISDTDSTESVPFWPAVHNVMAVQEERIKQVQPTTVFPGFENLS